MSEPFFVILILFLIFFDLALSFICFPLKFGKNYYAVQFGSVYQYHSVIGYVLKSNLRYKNPTVPPRNAPRKISFVDLRTDQNGFVFDGDMQSLKEKK